MRGMVDNFRVVRYSARGACEVEERTNKRTRQSEIFRRLDNDQWVIVPHFSTRMSAG